MFKVSGTVCLLLLFAGCGSGGEMTKESAETAEAMEQMTEAEESPQAPPEEPMEETASSDNGSGSTNIDDAPLDKFVNFRYDVDGDGIVESGVAYTSMIGPARTQLWRISEGSPSQIGKSYMREKEGEAAPWGEWFCASFQGFNTVRPRICAA